MWLLPRCSLESLSVRSGGIVVVVVIVVVGVVVVVVAVAFVVVSRGLVCVCVEST